MREIKIGKVYRHFKGNYYLVLDIVRDSEDEDNKIVIYEALYGEGTKWARSYASFISLVDKDKYPLVEQKYRFEEMDDYNGK